MKYLRDSKGRFISKKKNTKKIKGSIFDDFDIKIEVIKLDKKIDKKDIKKIMDDFSKKTGIEVVEIKDKNFIKAITKDLKKRPLHKCKNKCKCQK